jgi:rubrerythrin
MSVDLNVDEVFQMAEQVERDGRAFFERAASGCTDRRCRQTLLDLASMEGDHERIFAGMRARLRERGITSASVADDVGRKWSVIVNLLGSGVQEDLAQRFTGRESSDEILRKAIGFEKDTVVFFLGMRHVLPDQAAGKEIDDIIREELGHIITLTSKLAVSE